MMNPPDLETIEHIIDHLGRARSILFVTGAGMSADSGLPTYRGVGGLYDGGETVEGIAIEEMLSGEMFGVRPEWTWKYLRQIEQACRGAKFNRGHAVIAEMERQFERVWTLTQNVDGFHHEPGHATSSQSTANCARSAAPNVRGARPSATTRTCLTCRAAVVAPQCCAPMLYYSEKCSPRLASEK
jgi:NAD-dependent SIR2 family protein deacetylase